MGDGGIALGVLGGETRKYGSTGDKETLVSRTLILSSDDETGEGRSSKMKHLLGLGLAVLSVLGITLLVVQLQPKERGGSPSYPARVPDDAISFEEFLHGDFRAKGFNGSWWSDEELQWRDLEGNLVTWDFTNNQTSVLVSHDLLTSISSSGAQFMGFSPDASLLLFATEVQNIWRHSFTARYLIFDPVKNSTQEVLGKGAVNRLQYCDWVERDNSNKNALVLVYENNLYWREDVLDDPEDDLALSADGLVDSVFNGIPDWVYEEEVLGTNYAHYINELGSRIAFAKFNDSLVPEFRYPHYGDPAKVEEWQYPEYRTVRYPKAGETNPTVSLWVRCVAPLQCNDGGNKLVVAPPEVTIWGEYIYTVAEWTSDDVLSVTWMNRIQNSSCISECREEGSQWQCVAILTQKQAGGWIEIAPSPVYNSNGDFLVVLPSRQESGLNFPHVAMVPVGGGEWQFLTSGEFAVVEILHWDEENNLVYLMGTDPDSPGARHLYTATSDGETMTCVTCELQTSRGEFCQRSSVLPNWSFSHYVHSCLGQGVPDVVLRKTSDHSIVFNLEDNALLNEKLEGKALPTRVDTFVDLPDGFRAPVKLLLPPHMEEGAQYPLLVYVYGGPGSQMVTQSWGVGWGEYLATTRNVVYASIDGRGTGFQSNEHLFQVYRQLGTVEMEDQIAVARQLVEEASYLDPTRVAIWGWSYGGFATALTLEQDNSDSPVFSCGISVAPVSSWLLYDSIYTERYMATPQENPGGYNHSVISEIEGLRNKTWMLNHGVADDNVHYQHTMLLTKALERADIQFVQHSYPDENHSLGGVSRFLYHAMDSFWEDCFKEKTTM